MAGQSISPVWDLHVAWQASKACKVNKDRVSQSLNSSLVWSPVSEARAGAAQRHFAIAVVLGYLGMYVVGTVTQKTHLPLHNRSYGTVQNRGPGSGSGPGPCPKLDLHLLPDRLDVPADCVY